jgi:hypothetical protein
VELDEDRMVHAVIHQGENQFVDLVISLLQSSLERKRPFVAHARLAGLDGMRLSRAAFGVMIKFSEFFDAFTDVIDEVDMQYTMLEGDEDRNLKIKETIEAMPHYDNIFKRWESASNMRKWINEKKSNLTEKIKKEVEADYKKKKEEEKAKAAEQPKAEEAPVPTEKTE